jgi:single-strand DNA-binding protein
MNSVCLIGRLTRDPELKTFEGGANNSSLCSFTLAVNTTKDKTAFIPVQVYGDRADLIAKSLRKGHLIGVQGRLDQDTYQNQAGEKKVITYIKLDNFDYLEKKETTEKTPKEQLESQKSFTADDVSKLDLPDDDLPF